MVPGCHHVLIGLQYLREALEPAARSVLPCHGRRRAYTADSPRQRVLARGDRARRGLVARRSPTWRRRSHRHNAPSTLPKTEDEASTGSVDTASSAQRRCRRTGSPGLVGEERTAEGDETWADPASWVRTVWRKATDRRGRPASSMDLTLPPGRGGCEVRTSIWAIYRADLHRARQLAHTPSSWSSDSSSFPLLFTWFQRRGVLGCTGNTRFPCVSLCEHGCGIQVPIWCHCIIGDRSSALQER